jgi:subtilase family serine protease
LPDLLFTNVSASKKGRYLSFGVTVINRGLRKSGSTNLSLFYDDRELDSFELEDFEVGRGKILNVENLKVPRALDEVVFVIDDGNNVLEIDENNNQAVLSIKN